METYADKNGNSGISSYKLGTDYIWVRFTSGVTYEYTYSSAGSSSIEIMKSLAISGSGLNSYIMKYVKKSYSRIIR